MIQYHKNGIHHVLNIFRCQGSVFPRIFGPALLCGAIAGTLKHFLPDGADQDSSFMMRDTTMWQGFSWVVGFLVVFRTSMAYNRFWEGVTKVYQMRAEWMDACSNLFAFMKYATPCEEREVKKLQHLLARLFSMLHALALAEIEDSSSKMPEDIFAYQLPLIDPNGIDHETMSSVMHSNAKAELTFQWIQQLIVQSIHNPTAGKTGVLTIPPPILSRVFQELSSGMVCLQEAIAVSSVPFPFPYAQTCDMLLTLYWVLTPLVVCQWFTSPLWAALFTFIVVFVLWVLNSIAVEIENPFGNDANDMDCTTLHAEMNTFLLQLMSVEQHRVPLLQPGVELLSKVPRTASFVEAWRGQAGVLDDDITRSCRVRRPSLSSTTGGSPNMLKASSFSSVNSNAGTLGLGRGDASLMRKGLSCTSMQSWQSGGGNSRDLAHRLEPAASASPSFVEAGPGSRASAVEEEDAEEEESARGCQLADQAPTASAVRSNHSGGSKTRIGANPASADSQRHHLAVDAASASAYTVEARASTDQALKTMRNGHGSQSAGTVGRARM